MNKAVKKLRKIKDQIDKLEEKEDVGFYQRKQVQITYEEVKHGDSGTGANEVRPGTQVGQESFNIAT